MRWRRQSKKGDSELAISIGDTSPAFELPDTQGELHPHPDGANATVVIFTCNHCPYALAWHDRLQDVARDFAGRDVRFFSINSNDASRYPADSLDAMRARVNEEDWPMPYLHDESQEVARAWGAKTTPDVFVLDGDGVLRYRGAPDADYDDPTLNAAWLRQALQAVLNGEQPEPAETEPVGCSIKWAA
jgi:peroxiredoxin